MKNETEDRGMRQSTMQSAEEGRKAMNSAEVKQNRANEVRRLGIGFTCPKCKGHTMKWRSGGDSPREAIIEEVMLLEGNSHPVVHGEYRIGCSAETLDHPSEDSEWRCAACGLVLANDDGSPLQTKKEVVRWLVGNCYFRDEEAEKNRLAEDYEGCLNSLFECCGGGSLGPGDEALTLSCPECGHQEFVQLQEAVTFTPVRTVEGRLTWQYGEQLLADHWDSQETHYQCLKCGFEAPEPFDDWVEAGCPADWDDCED
jgi:predicted RNA-binding Zn-ribbon protein involved in translation (DUF1610 family)